MDLFEGVREICIAFPEVTERLSHGAPTWFVRDKKTFVQLWPEGHHQNHFSHLWCAAPEGVQEELVTTEPERFFRPPYVGGRGWLGVRLDVDVDWDEIAALCEDAYRVVAPKRLVSALEALEAWARWSKSGMSPRPFMPNSRAKPKPRACH